MSYDGEIVIGTRIDSDGLKQDLKNLENEFKGGKVSKRIGKDDIGEPLVEGIKVAINDSGFKVSEAVKRYFEEVEIQKKMGVISEEEYYKKLEELRDKYLAKGTKEWWKYTTAIVQYETKLYEEEQRQIEKIFDELDKNVEKSVSSYERKMEALEDKKDEFSLKLSNDDLLTKISMNIDGKNMSEFSDGVWKRKKRENISFSAYLCCADTYCSSPALRDFSSV